MDLQTKKILLIGAGIACLLLAYYGSQAFTEEFTKWLSVGAGGLHAFNLAISLAK